MLVAKSPGGEWREEEEDEEEEEVEEEAEGWGWQELSRGSLFSARVVKGANERTGGQSQS